MSLNISFFYIILYLLFVLSTDPFLFHHRINTERKYFSYDSINIEHNGFCFNKTNLLHKTITLFLNILIDDDVKIFFIHHSETNIPVEPQ